MQRTQPLNIRSQKRSLTNQSVILFAHIQSQGSQWWGGWGRLTKVCLKIYQNPHPYQNPNTHPESANEKGSFQQKEHGTVLSNFDHQDFNYYENRTFLASTSGCRNGPPRYIARYKGFAPTFSYGGMDGRIFGNPYPTIWNLRKNPASSNTCYLIVAKN